MSLQSWDLIRAFLALHRAGSFEGAARLLKIDHSTIRRKIQSLEQDVGATLFVRRDGTLVLAPGQETTLHAALQMEAAFGFFQQHTEMSRQAGTIRISTLDILASLLAPEFRRFQAANPGIQLAITTEAHFVDLERDMVDIAIRLARPLKGQDGLKKLGTLGFRVYGSAEYLARAGRGPHDLLSLYAHFMRNDHEFSLAEEKWHEDDSFAGTVVARSDSYPTLLRLCEEGLGLAMLPCLLGRTSTPLRQFGSMGTEVDIYAIIRKDVASLPRMRLMVNFLAVAFRSLGGVLAGGENAAAPWPLERIAAT
jgi:DNA-binding transcriptional LysR family regulator